MKGSISAPTTRVLDVVELLARQGNSGLKFADIARELGLTQATAHTILKTLDDRGWITRDSINKTFSLGPALAVVAAHVEASRPRATAAKRAAIALRDELQTAASVIERVGDSLVITAYEGVNAGTLTSPPGEPIPFAPPFGAAFAAWSNAADQRAWIARSASTNVELTRRLQLVLDRTRERGYEVDRTTPALGQLLRMVGAARDDVPHHVRTLMEELLAECAVIGLDNTTDAALSTTPVVSIVAPVFSQGAVNIVLCVHPMTALSQRRTDNIGRRLAAVASELSDGVAAPRTCRS